jgi:hypothetical protein
MFLFQVQYLATYAPVLRFTVLPRHLKYISLPCRLKINHMTEIRNVRLFLGTLARLQTIKKPQNTGNCFSKTVSKPFCQLKQVQKTAILKNCVRIILLGVCTYAFIIKETVPVLFLSVDQKSMECTWLHPAMYYSIM